MASVYVVKVALYLPHAVAFYPWFCVRGLTDAIAICNAALFPLLLCVAAFAKARTLPLINLLVREKN